MPDIFISGKPAKKMPDSCLPPQATSDRDMPYHVYYDFQESKTRSPSLGMGNTHRNKMKWLNSPVLATQYVKEPRESVGFYLILFMINCFLQILKTLHKSVLFRKLQY